MSDDLLDRLRDAATNIALNPQMPTRDLETQDMAHDEIARLRERIEKLEACVKAGTSLANAVAWIDVAARVTDTEAREIDRVERAFRSALGEVEREG